jgi:hypothetical protein
MELHTTMKELGKWGNSPGGDIKFGTTRMNVYQMVCVRIEA